MSTDELLFTWLIIAISHGTNSNLFHTSPNFGGTVLQSELNRRDRIIQKIFRVFVGLAEMKCIQSLTAGRFGSWLSLLIGVRG